MYPYAFVHQVGWHTPSFQGIFIRFYHEHIGWGYFYHQLGTPPILWRNWLDIYVHWFSLRATLSHNTWLDVHAHQLSEPLSHMVAPGVLFVGPHWSYAQISITTHEYCLWVIYLNQGWPKVPRWMVIPALVSSDNHCGIILAQYNKLCQRV